MKQVDEYRWWVTSRPGEREYLTNYYMDAATAADRYLTARPHTAYHRTITRPETEEEMREAQFHYQSAGHDGAKPPKK